MKQKKCNVHDVRKKKKVRDLKATEVIRLKSVVNSKFMDSLHSYSTNKSVCPQPLSSTDICMLIALIFNGSLH